MTTTFPSYDGTMLAYRTIGSGPLLVCLPGGPGRNSAYLENLAGLDETNTLLLLDSRGTGESALPADEFSYGAESLARDVEALREHLGLDRLRLLGHSAGGRVAQLWAIANPERVERLALVTTEASDRDRRNEARAAAMALRRDEPWFAEANEAAEGLAYAGPGERARLERMIRPFWYGAWTDREQQHAASADSQTSPRASSRFIMATPRQELLAGLALLVAPTLVVDGELDGLIPPVFGAELAAAIPSADRVLIPGAGHFPWIDAPGAFRAAVGPFLAA